MARFIQPQDLLKANSIILSERKSAKKSLDKLFLDLLFSYNIKQIAKKPKQIYIK